MQCYKDDDKKVNSCKNCLMKPSCKHDSIFIDSNIFLKIIFGESDDAPNTEKSFNHLKKTCVLFTSHLNVGEIFNKICEQYKYELSRTSKSNAYDTFTQLCLKAQELLERICLLELDRETIAKTREIIRREDTQNRDRLMLSTAISHKLNSFYTCDEKFVNTIKRRINNSTIKIIYWKN